MKPKFAALFLLLFAFVALAGTRFVTTTGALPTSNTDGVPLAWMTFCRGSVRNGDGGTIMGGNLVPYYRDSQLPWSESASSMKCALDTNNQVDGGSRYLQVCNWPVTAPFGRFAVVGEHLIDAFDASVVVPTIRVECWSNGASAVDGGGTP